MGSRARRHAQIMTNKRVPGAKTMHQLALARFIGRERWKLINFSASQISRRRWNYASTAHLISLPLHAKNVLQHRALYIGADVKTTAVTSCHLKSRLGAVIAADKHPDKFAITSKAILYKSGKNNFGHKCARVTNFKELSMNTTTILVSSWVQNVK